MKKIFFCLLLISISMLAKAQSDSTWKFQKHYYVNFELLGSSVLYSFNFERLIIQSQRFHSFLSVGFSYAPYRFFSDKSDLQGLVNFNQQYSFSKNNHIDAGFGMKLLKDYKSEKIDLLTLFMFHLGYRYQKPNGNFNFKLLATGSIYKSELMIYPPARPTYQPNFFPCFGIGYAF